MGLDSDGLPPRLAPSAQLEVNPRTEGRPSPLRRVDHTAVVVADLNDAINRWQALSGAQLETREVVAHQGVEIAMLILGDTKLELISPLDAVSGVSRFLQKQGESLHHVAFEVDDIAAAIEHLTLEGYQLIDSEPRRGAHGLVAFLHPRSTGGVLVELIEIVQ